jgi:hypothetical protein
MLGLNLQAFFLKLPYLSRTVMTLQQFSQMLEILLRAAKPRS